MMTDQKKCPDCGGKTVRYGVVWSGRRRMQRYLCKDCGRLVYSALAPDDAIAEG